MSLPLRIILFAGSAAVCVAAAWLLAPDDDGALPPGVAAGAPARTSWGASPFAPAPVETDASGVGFAPIFAPLPGALYGRNGRAIDLDGMDVAAYVAQWSARARKGDPVAAYKVYQAVDVCAKLADPLPEFASDAQRDEAHTERQRVEQLCSGVSQAQIEERMRFLNDAARAGNTDAQIDFFMEGPNGRPVEQSNDDAALQLWKTEALGYLTSAGQRGDAFALGLLANAYDAGNIVEPDAKTSLAYTVANAAARNLTLSQDALHARFGQLSPGDFDGAVQSGTQMGAACCAR